MRLFRIVLLVMLLPLLAAAFYTFSVYPNQIIALSSERLLQVPKGIGFNQLCRQLQGEQIVRYCAPLKWYSKIHSNYRDIKAGSYLLKPGQTHTQLLVLLSEGIEHQFSVTLVEGERLSQILAKLAATEHLKHDIDDRALLAQRLGSRYDNIEGLLYPDTYYYAANSNSFDIILRAYKKMAQFLDNQWQTRSPDLPYDSAYEALIMASIIEKETAQPTERTLIASVFVNRLRKKMRLQTDPTVIYGLGEQFDGDITRAHLRQKTAYNTYRIDGLPPTPIAMPGGDSIIAALHPATTNFLYFVSKQDGSHYFSQTLAEHNRAVRKYQLGKHDEP